MKLTITTADDQLFSLEVPGDIEIENLKVYCEVECGIPAGQISLLWNGQLLSDGKKSLESYGAVDGDMLFLQKTVQGRSGLPNLDFSGIPTPSSQRSTEGRRPVDPRVLREMILASPEELSLLRQNNPPLADSINDPAKFVEVFTRQTEERRTREAEQLALLTANPFDPEVQRKIHEAIQQKNVDANMEAAMEYSPESFGQVHMLYINCKVNGHDVKAFVDSGAQMTIMSKTCAERCNISHLMDKRWSGVAKGVGIQRILGRIHFCNIAIGPDHLQCSFSILEDQPMDMLLGLDMLKRHLCCLDMKRNLLVIGTTGTETPFLPENELPEHARLNRSISESDHERDIAEAMITSQQEAAAANSGPSSSGAFSGGVPSGRAASTSSTNVPEGVRKIMSSGFSQGQATEALRKTNGDADRALLDLLAQSLFSAQK